MELSDAGAGAALAARKRIMRYRRSNLVSSTEISAMLPPAITARISP